MKDTSVGFRRFVLAASCGVAALLFGWLIGAEASPFHQYFLWHVAVPNAWGRLNLPALFIGFAVSGNVHQPDEVDADVAAFAQWCLVGYLLSLLLVRRSSAKREQA